MEGTMNQKQKPLILLGVLAALLVLFLGVYALAAPKTQQGDKTITVEVVHGDDSTKTFTYETAAEYLGELLLAEGLIQGEQGPYGLYIIQVDGERAVYETDGAYWALYQGGDYASTGVDQTPMADGDVFSLVYTVG